MCEMIKIMQEYGEVTCCLGSSANLRNSCLFLQSDIRSGGALALAKYLLGILRPTWVGGVSSGSPRLGQFRGTWVWWQEEGFPPSGHH